MDSLSSPSENSINVIIRQSATPIVFSERDRIQKPTPSLFVTFLLHALSTHFSNLTRKTLHSHIFHTNKCPSRAITTVHSIPFPIFIPFTWESTPIQWTEHSMCWAAVCRCSFSCLVPSPEGTIWFWWRSSWDMPLRGSVTFSLRRTSLQRSSTRSTRLLPTGSCGSKFSRERSHWMLRAIVKGFEWVVERQYELSFRSLNLNNNWTDTLKRIGSTVACKFYHFI